MKKLIAIISGLLFGLLSLYVLYRVMDFYVLLSFWELVFHTIPYGTIIYVLIWLINTYLLRIDYKLFSKYSIPSAFLAMIVFPLIFVFDDFCINQLPGIINGIAMLTLIVGVPILVVLFIQIVIKKINK